MKLINCFVGSDFTKKIVKTIINNESFLDKKIVNAYRKCDYEFLSILFYIFKEYEIPRCLDIVKTRYSSKRRSIKVVTNLIAKI